MSDRDYESPFRPKLIKSKWRRANSLVTLFVFLFFTTKPVHELKDKLLGCYLICKIEMGPERQPF